MLLLGGGMALADTPDCNVNTAAESSAQLVSLPQLGAPSALIGGTMIGFNEDGLGADGSTAYSCSLQIMVAQGQKRVVLVEGWNYIQSKYPGDCQGCEANNITVSLTGLPPAFPYGQTYTSSQTGYIDQPPSGSWIALPPWSLISPFPTCSTPDGSCWYLNKYTAFDVSSFTAKGSLTLTLNVRIAIASQYSNDWQGEWWNPITVAAGVFGGTRFTLSQTESAFRPRDARDAAAQCGQADPASGRPLDRDCHPQFTATLAGLESYGPILAGAIAPSIAFALTAATPLAAAGTWLQGTSTNYGTDAATDPDYMFEFDAQPAQSKPLLAVQNLLAMQTNPGSIRTGADPNGAPSTTVSMPITVTSQDFGGKAYLRAALTLGPGAAAIDAEIVDPITGKDVPAPVDNKPIGTCGTDFASHPFASLPVDQDCNGVADSWEGQYTNPPGGHLDPMADNEPGYDGTTVGDGYSVHDEYRGFHYIQDTVDTADNDNPTGVVRWTSTDPVNMQDVFFWDSAVGPGPGHGPATGPCNAPANSTLQPNCITTALRTLLEPEMVNPQGRQFMRFWRVNALQAHATPSADPSLGVGWLNRNSITMPAAGASILGLGGYALVYGSKPEELDGVSDCGASPPSLNGTYAQSNQFANNGESFVNIALPQIAACGYIAQQAPGDGGYPQGTFLAEVVAHETGHRFGLFHTYRPIVYQGEVVENFVGLTMENYMDDLETMYVRFTTTPVSSALNPPYQKLERLPDLANYTFPPYLYCPNQEPLRRPVVSKDPWILSGCNFERIPHKTGPVPAPGSCMARYATQAAPSGSQAYPPLPFLVLETTGLVVGPTRGRLLGQLDMMGFNLMFNRSWFGTDYGFDPVCELPHLTAGPVPQRAN
jgi:hypothetical protein